MPTAGCRCRCPRGAPGRETRLARTAWSAARCLRDCHATRDLTLFVVAAVAHGNFTPEPAETGDTPVQSDVYVEKDKDHVRQQSKTPGACPMI